MFEATDRLTERARRLDARAITRPDILALSATGATTFPRYIARASGAYLWDVDRNQYVDFLMGYGPVVLGHADTDVDSAVIAELSRGTCFAPLWSPRQVELVELLTSTIPGAEQALLLKTGSDATSAAVRLARIHTGRDLVLRSGYNGWHDWSVEQPDGVPAAVRANTIRFDASDLSGLERLLAAHGARVACVMLMPFEDETTSTQHLAAIRSLTHRAGALLAFDEMRSGFRISVGGAQEFFGVGADLGTFSKAMANGYTISAVTGSAAILDGLRRTKISSSFHVNPGDMVAAIATITRLRDSDALSRIWRLGELFQAGLREIIDELGVPAEVVGYPPSPFLRFVADDHHRNGTMAQDFCAQVVGDGVLLHPEHQWFISAAHTDGDIDRALSACHKAMVRCTSVAMDGPGRRLAGHASTVGA